ncbi:MAG: sigma-70 family RNA polymerase sigma factor [Novosphingobium sp.]|nr:sigma-70 family RNA polymerase sigma factor [Novosphingobium sp.]
MISNHQSFATARAYNDPTAAVVERFVPMVRKLAWHLHGSAGSDIEPEDLVQAGLVALTECAQRHSGPDADGFAAYAKIRVKGAMIDQLRRSAPLSRGAIQRRREIREAENRLWGRLGREPSTAELAAAMDLAPRELNAMRTASEPLHFDSIDEAYSDTDMAFRDQSADAFTVMVSSENREALIAAISGLPKRLQLVIQLYFVEELNLSEIAGVLGVTVPRVHQLKDQALQKIRSELLRYGVESSE